MLKYLGLLLVCFACSTTATDFKDGVVIVSAEVPINGTINIKPPSVGDGYRVYATYSRQANNTDFARGIQIRGSNGYTTLRTLANSLTYNFQLLNVELKGSTITVTDTTGYDRSPFTIYFAPTNCSEYPVISAGKDDGRLYSDVKMIADGVTILSAEPSFNLYSFDLGSMSGLTIGTNGYDANTNDYQVMKIDDPSRANGSILTIASPICTLYKNSANRTDSFSFIMDTKEISSYNIANRGFVSILSPGWLDYGHSFTTDWKQTNTNTTIDFGTDNYLDMNLQLGEIFSEESLHLQIIANGGGITYNSTYTYQTKDQPQSYGRVVSVSTSSTNYNHNFAIDQYYTLDYGHSFTTDWKQTNTNTTIDFGTDNYLDMNLQLGEIFSEESLHLQIIANGGGITYNSTYTYQTKDQPQSYGRVVSVSTSSTNYNHVPRFLLQIR